MTTLIADAPLTEVIPAIQADAPSTETHSPVTISGDDIIVGPAPSLDSTDTKAPPDKIAG